MIFIHKILLKRFV